MGRRSLTYPRDDGHRAGLRVEEGRADRRDRLIYCGPRREIRVLILQGEILNQDSEGSGLATYNVRKRSEERWPEKTERTEGEVAASEKASHFTARK